MLERQMKTAIGGMLHDIGKVLYRADDHRNHSLSGYEFLRDEVGITDPDILDQVRYHHAAFLKEAHLPKNSLAYITYMADNISAAADRRENDTAESGFERTAPLDSIFNILNGSHQHRHYPPAILERNEVIHYPNEENVVFAESFYRKIKESLREELHGLKDTGTIPVGYMNSLLEVMEADLSFIPSATSRKEIADISLYDHVKLTAAIGNCILAYLTEQGREDFRDILFVHGEQFQKENAFLLFSMDMSGIQKFIYHQYGTEDVLKNLRARSFFLDIMMENMADELLDNIGISRANLIYSGGGHAYMLLPNTEAAKKAVRIFESDTDAWMLEEFNGELFLACGYAQGSANDLENKPFGAYQNLFREASASVSDRKLHRYSAQDILYLNQKTGNGHERECRVCHRSDHLTEEDLCEVCSGLIRLSNGILNKDFFTVQQDIGQNHSEDCIPIWKNELLFWDTEKSLRSKIAGDHTYIRSYAKNQRYVGDSLAAKFWVGSYCSDSTIEKIVAKGTGIRRLGVLRADIDNLGQAFVAGFPAEYQTLSRAASFSRKLSLFFKLHINDLLSHGEFSLDGGTPTRNVAIIYSGGDDVFIIGAWKDILEFSVDLYHAVQKFTQGTLTFSAGFGIYQEKYPISYIAADTGRLEDRSKQMDGKNAITLFEPVAADSIRPVTTWHWDDFIDHVLREKYGLIADFFLHSQERGKNFLYHILELYRSQEDKLDLARLAYILTRLEPAPDAPQEDKERYHNFALKMIEWKKSSQDRAEVMMAIYLYAYTIRTQEDNDNVWE